MAFHRWRARGEPYFAARVRDLCRHCANGPVRRLDAGGRCPDGGGWWLDGVDGGPATVRSVRIPHARQPVEVRPRAGPTLASLPSRTQVSPSRCVPVPQTCDAGAAASPPEHAATPPSAASVPRRPKRKLCPFIRTPMLSGCREYRRVPAPGQRAAVRVRPSPRQRHSRRRSAHAGRRVRKIVAGATTPHGSRSPTPPRGRKRSARRHGRPPPCDPRGRRRLPRRAADPRGRGRLARGA